MLKSAILTTFSITSLLSIASIAGAGSIAQKSAHHSAERKIILLTAEQSIITVPASDLKGIRQAMSQYFKSENEQCDSVLRGIKSFVEGGGCHFIEVKKLQLVEFSSMSATVAVDFVTHDYTLHVQEDSRQPTLEKNKSVGAPIAHYSRILSKVNGKWKIN
jgi:hypothetical protein